MQYVDYRQIISALPFPSRQQIRQFAAYVSKAHSWYKHLPIYPKSCIHFYLDPNAGCLQVRRPLSGEAGELVEVTHNDGSLHHATKATDAYRTEFGFWNYNVPLGTAPFHDSRGADTQQTLRESPSVLDSGGAQVAVELPLLQAGSAAISSLVYPQPDYHLFWAIPPDNPSIRLVYPGLFEQNIGVVPEGLRQAIIDHGQARARWQSVLEHMAVKYGVDVWKIMSKEAAMLREDRLRCDGLEEEMNGLAETRIDVWLDRMREDELSNMEDAMVRFLDMASK